MKRVPPTEMKKNKGNVDACFFQQLKESSLHPSVLKQARRSGQLNLSGRGLAEVPDVIWNINMLTSEEVKSLSLSMNTVDEGQWWDHVELTKLLLASNALKSISPAIQNLQALTTLDLHDNALTSLPSTLSELKNLKKLDLSRNAFPQVPSCVFELKALCVFLVQRNELTSLTDDIGNFSILEELDVSYNKLKKLPPCIGFLSRVNAFNASNNELTHLPTEIGDLAVLKRLELSYNNIKELPESLGRLRHMEQLYLQHNNIESLPPLFECTSLKEIHCGFNNIQELSPEFLEHFVGVKYLDLKDNKISEISDNITWMQSLEVLHLSNNNLSSLPFAMGNLPHLKTLTVDGNPMRCIRRDIIQRGTQYLLKWMQSRIKETTPSKATNSRSEVDSHGALPDKFALRSTKSLNYSNRGLNSIPEDIVKLSVEAEVNVVDLSKNNLTDVCDVMKELLPQLTELNLGFNRLDRIPTWFGISERLQYLDIRNNKIEDLPAELSRLDHLREINCSFNKLQVLPPVLYSMKKLEIIIGSNNQITEIDVPGLSQLPMIAVLDLHDNSIKKVPPELGNVTQLRSLLLDGNLFRNPRPAVLMKGTGPLLEYLRNQIVKQE